MDLQYALHALLVILILITNQKAFIRVLYAVQGVIPPGAMLVAHSVMQVMPPQL